MSQCLLFTTVRKEKAALQGSIVPPLPLSFLCQHAQPFLAMRGHVGFMSSSGLQGSWEETIFEGSVYGVSGSLSGCSAASRLWVAGVSGTEKVREFTSR